MISCSTDSLEAITNVCGGAITLVWLRVSEMDCWSSRNPIRGAGERIHRSANEQWRPAISTRTGPRQPGPPGHAPASLPRQEPETRPQHHPHPLFLVQTHSVSPAPQPRRPSVAPTGSRARDASLRSGAASRCVRGRRCERRQATDGLSGGRGEGAGSRRGLRKLGAAAKTRAHGGLGLQARRVARRGCETCSRLTPPRGGYSAELLAAIRYRAR